MNEAQKKIIVAWLNDAHAMEESLVVMLEKQIQETEAFPDIQTRLEEHRDETRRHAELMEGCLKALDESPSATKDTLAKLTAQLNGFGLSLTQDTLVKGLHGSYAAEQFEIATYTILRAAAQELNQRQIVDACEEILADEERMAGWVMERLPGVALDHLRRQPGG